MRSFLKKTTLFVLGALCISQVMQADERDYRFQVNASYFVPLQGRYKSFYGNQFPVVGIEFTSKIFCHQSVWVDFNYYTKSKSHGSCCSSRIQNLNGSVGIRFLQPFSRSTLGYLGFGPTVSWIELKNKAGKSSDNIKKMVPGVVAKSGVYISISDPLYVNFFVDYSYLPIHLKKYVDSGGIKAGAGIGISY